MGKKLSVACILSILALFSGHSSYAQIKRTMHAKKESRMQDVPIRFLTKGHFTDTMPGLSWLSIPSRTTCKAVLPVQLAYFDGTDTILAVNHADKVDGLHSNSPLIRIRGNILYDVNYRSSVNTPFAEKDIYQHTVQTYLDITWKDRYPFRMYLTNHFGNSNWFKNYTDLNFQFNADEFSDQVKAKLIAAIKKAVRYDSLEAIEKSLIAKKNEYSQLSESLKDPAFLQKLIEAKERSLRKKMPVDTSSLANFKSKIPVFGLSARSLSRFTGKASPDSLKSRVTRFSRDSSLAGLQNRYQAKKDKLDSLRKQITRLDSLYKRARFLKDSGTEMLTRNIQELRNPSSWQDKLKQFHISDSVLPRGYKKLLALKKFGIGRSIADYSELSAKNISITGIQAEYNPRYYYAFAAGTVDYQFRDYLAARPGLPKQYLALVRVGKGDKDGNHLIFTYYTGQKQLFNGNATQQGQTRPNYNLMGITVEGRYALSPNTFLTVELAKSSFPYYSRDSVKRSSQFGNVLQFQDHSNEAYAASLVSFIPSTQTTINATYRHSGANFQSFSLFNSGASQTSWLARVSQPLFKHQLLLTASIRKNDYYNPFINTSYSANALLKSIQGTCTGENGPLSL